MSKTEVSNLELIPLYFLYSLGKRAAYLTAEQTP